MATAVTKPVGVVTLLYSPDYLPGVLTLGTQLREKTRTDEITTCVVVSQELFLERGGTDADLELIRSLYDLVLPVESSRQLSDALLELHRENLELLDRPELAFTFLKLELWRLTQFSKVVYIDCDCLLVSSAFWDILTLTQDQASHEIAASPDCGWPDMFNSGVLALVPDLAVYDQLAKLVLTTQSIDGADQGILNQFFNKACREVAAPTEQDNASDQDSGWVRLPFTYNVTVPNAGYQNAPAAKFFDKDIKLVHFIGKNKPWISKTEHSDRFRDQWWQIYLGAVQRCSGEPTTGQALDHEDDPEQAESEPQVAPNSPPPQWDATKEPPPVDGAPEAASFHFQPEFEWNQGDQLLEDELPSLQLGPNPIFPWETYSDAVEPQRVFPE